MNPRNFKEIVQKYLVFTGYFSCLLILTVLCVYFFFKSTNAYAGAISQKKKEMEKQQASVLYFSSRIDSLNTFMRMMNTDLVENEAALERSILKLSKGALNELEQISESEKHDFILTQKIFTDTEKLLEIKRQLQKAKAEEDNFKQKLMECNAANRKLRNR